VIFDQDAYLANLVPGKNLSTNAFWELDEALHFCKSARKLHILFVIDILPSWP